MPMHSDELDAVVDPSTSVDTTSQTFLLIFSLLQRLPVSYDILLKESSSLLGSVSQTLHSLPTSDTLTPTAQPDVMSDATVDHVAVSDMTHPAPARAITAALAALQRPLTDAAATGEDGENSEINVFALKPRNNMLEVFGFAAVKPKDATFAHGQSQFSAQSLIKPRRKRYLLPATLPIESLVADAVLNTASTDSSSTLASAVDGPTVGAAVTNSDPNITRDSDSGRSEAGERGGTIAVITSNAARYIDPQRDARDATPSAQIWHSLPADIDIDEVSNAYFGSSEDLDTDGMNSSILPSGALPAVAFVGESGLSVESDATPPAGNASSEPPSPDVLSVLDILTT